MIFIMFLFLDYVKDVKFLLGIGVIDFFGILYEFGWIGYRNWVCWFFGLLWMSFDFIFVIMFDKFVVVLIYWFDGCEED